MGMNIKSAETEALARQLAALTGESLTRAIATALRERLERLQRDSSRRSLARELDEIAIRTSRLPLLDSRQPDEILGYDEHGIPR